MTVNQPCSLTPLTLLFTCLFAASLLLGCQSGNGPEEEIRRFVERGEEAIENSEVARVRGMVAENYRDDRNRTKRDLISILTYHMLRQKSIYLLQVIDEIRITSDQSAELSLFVAMTGRPVTDNSLLPQFQADIYHFTISVIKDGDNWQVTSASWKPAVLDDVQERLNDHENT